jgi:tetratricopeptide (TPR) repeat protein
MKLRESKLGPDHPQTLQSRRYLAENLRWSSRTAEAIALLEPTLKLQESKYGPGYPDTNYTRNALASAYESLGRRTEAEPLLRDVLALYRKTESQESPILAGSLADLGRNLIEQSRWSEAEPILRECLAIREKAVPGEWRRFNAMSLLGEALLGQGQFAEAEPLVMGGYEGVKAREATIPVQLKRILSFAEKRVVQLYKEWGKTEQEKAWASKLGLADLPPEVFARP